MTEFWKSNAMHWCDLCKVWMNDTKAAKLNHERGMKHQENLAKKLRDMGKKAEREKQVEADTKVAMVKIEEAARKQFEKDQQAAEAAVGKWLYKPETGYYYNDVQRWYYDYKTKWYYGGEPATWTQQPGLSDAAKFENGKKEGGPAALEEQPAAGKAGAAGAAVGSSAAGSTAAATGGPGAKIVKKVIQLPQHPQAAIGGYQLPSAGKVGGAKGVGAQTAGGSSSEALKRKREQEASAAKAKGKAVTKEEAEFIARREAARQRVQQRTMTTFGLS